MRSTTFIKTHCSSLRISTQFLLPIIMLLLASTAARADVCMPSYSHECIGLGIKYRLEREGLREVEVATFTTLGVSKDGRPLVRLEITLSAGFRVGIDWELFRTKQNEKIAIRACETGGRMGRRAASAEFVRAGGIIEYRANLSLSGDSGEEVDNFVLADIAVTDCGPRSISFHANGRVILDFGESH